MKGAKADPDDKTISIPKINKITINGSNQNFFRCFKNAQRSFRNSILFKFRFRFIKMVVQYQLL